MPRISSHFSTLHCDFFKFPSAAHLLMIVRDVDDVVRAEELPVWPLDHKDLGCLVAGWKFSDRVGDAAGPVLFLISHCHHVLRTEKGARKASVAPRLRKNGSPDLRELSPIAGKTVGLPA